MAKTLMESFDSIIQQVEDKVNGDILKRYIPCDWKLLGTLLAIKQKLQRLEEKNREIEKAIEYLRERRAEDGNIGI